MAVPELRIAICRRCRQPERIASGAASADALLTHGKASCRQGGVEAHVRLSQCLNCCDQGHTVRLECRGREVALVGVRTEADLDEVIGAIEATVQGHPPEKLRRRVQQVWIDGRLVAHGEAARAFEGESRES
jgi:hypothetical protein